MEPGRAMLKTRRTNTPIPPRVRGYWRVEVLMPNRLSARFRHGMAQTSKINTPIPPRVRGYWRVVVLKRNRTWANLNHVHNLHSYRPKTDDVRPCHGQLRPRTLTIHRYTIS